MTYSKKSKNTKKGDKKMTTITGVVEKKGDKFNGSVFINGQWLNFKKGTDHSALKVGDSVTLSLEPWEFKGKSGVNVVSWQELGNVNDDNELTNSTPKPQTFEITKKMLENSPFKSRDFDAEARGKTRCQMFSAALQSPLLQQYFYTKEATLEEMLKTVREVANNGTDYTFNG